MRGVEPTIEELIEVHSSEIGFVRGIARLACLSMNSRALQCLVTTPLATWPAFRSNIMLGAFTDGSIAGGYAMDYPESADFAN